MLYFAFTQFYALALIPISVVGVISYFLLPAYDVLYAIALIVWNVGFKHAWDRRQRELAIQWRTRGVTNLVEQRRAAYITEGEKVHEITGEKVRTFPR